MDETAIYTLVIVMEKAETNLLKVINQRIQTPDDTEVYRTRATFKQICTDLTQGLFFYSRCLQERKIYHSDLKPANILRTEGRFVVADFGQAAVRKKFQNAVAYIRQIQMNCGVGYSKNRYVSEYEIRMNYKLRWDNSLDRSSLLRTSDIKEYVMLEKKICQE